MEDWEKRRQGNDFLFLFLNFDKVFLNSTPEKIAKIWRTEQGGISAIKFEVAQLYFSLCDVFVAVAVVVALKAPATATGTATGTPQNQ